MMMARQGPTKAVDDGFWNGRLANARAFLDAVQRLDALAIEGENANPLVAIIVHAAIAYGDALTAKSRGVVNRQDHQALPAAVRAAPVSSAAACSWDCLCGSSREMPSSNAAPPIVPWRGPPSGQPVKTEERGGCPLGSRPAFAFPKKLFNPA